MPLVFLIIFVMLYIVTKDLVGADVMKPLAIPMVGGLVTSTIHKAGYTHEAHSCCR